MKRQQSILSRLSLCLAGCFSLWAALYSACIAGGRTELPFHARSETLVVIPDTEGYVGRRPQTFNKMMRWVAEKREERNILYLLHVGDVTNNNTHHEWKNARKAFDIIEGKVPYVLAAGNHDYDHTKGRLAYMNEYFKVEDLKKRPTFGGVYAKGKLENHYQFLKVQDRDWMVLSLEMGPRQEVIEWANKVLSEHRNRLAIILTHGYLYYGSERYNHLRGSQRASPYTFYGEGADGEMRVSCKLGDVDNPNNRIGPFAGRFDELRVYGRALTANEVAGNFNSGPDKLNLAPGVPKPAVSGSRSPSGLPAWARRGYSSGMAFTGVSKSSS